MLGNFSYSNPTRLYFGDDAIAFLGEELKNYGKKVMLTYGGGSIKKNGIYDEVIKTLKDEGKDRCMSIYLELLCLPLLMRVNKSYFF